MNNIQYYYVDESGSGVIFNRKGNVVIGQDGAPRFFSLGLLDVEDPIRLDNDIRKLQQQIEGDPYFTDVPSVQKRLAKGGFFFHATDDIPEIRKMMFDLLRAE